MSSSFSLHRIMLHLESLAIFITAVCVYYVTGGSWLTFFALFLVPDLTVLGYITKNKKVGAIIYDLMHNYALVIALLAIGFFTDFNITSYGIILLAHISLDRFLGFGLRYTDVFRITHMQKV